MANFPRYDGVNFGDHYSADGGIPEPYFVTPATPPNDANRREVYDPDTVGVPQTPASESGSYGSGGYSPALSDISHHSQPWPIYRSESLTNYQPLPFSPSSFSPSSSPLGMLATMSIHDASRLSPSSSSPSSSPLGMLATMSIHDASRLSPESPSLHLPYVHRSSNSNGTLSPMLRPLLTFTSDDCAHWDPAFEDDYGTSSAVSPSEQPFPLLFDAPRLGFPEADHSAFGTHSRAQSDLTSSAGTSDHLTAPPRRHSFNTQRPGTPFFLPESGPSTPETSLSPSPFHSPSCSRDTTLDLPVLYPEVASPAGVYAAGLRRKKVARFSCDLPLCNATFTTNHNLKNHKNSHTGTKPYACRLCGNRFTTASVKRRHEKNSHDAQDWAQLDS